MFLGGLEGSEHLETHLQGVHGPAQGIPTLAV